MKTRRVRSRHHAGCAIRRRCCCRLARVNLESSSWRRQGRPGSSDPGRWEVVVRRRGLARLRRTLLLGLARVARLAQVVVVVAARQDDLLMRTEMGGCAQVVRSPSFSIITIIFASFCFF